MLQVRVGKRSPQAALRIALDMAQDDAFPLTRAEAVERVCRVLADPPTAVTERAAAARPLTRGPARLAGLASGEIVTDARGGDRRRRCRPAGDPRPGRDLARRRPRHGPGGRRPDRQRRAGQPRRGGGPRLGHPGRGRGVGPGAATGPT